MDDDSDGLDAVIDRALRRASLPASDDAHAGVPMHQSDAPAQAPLDTFHLDDGD